MTIACDFVDIRKQVMALQQPAFFLQRPLSDNAASSVMLEKQRVGTFWVPVLAIGQETAEHQLSWAMTRKGDTVRVPLHAYLTAPMPQDLVPEEQASRLVALGISLGVQALDDLMFYVQSTPLHMQLLIGTQVDHVPSGLRAYVGMAIRTE
jgi:hypothetical protein